MIQLSNIEQGAEEFLQRLERDITEASENFSTEDGVAMAISYVNLINARVDTVIQNIPRGALNALLLETVDILRDQVRNQALTEIDQILIAKNELQMNEARDILLIGKSNTDEYKKLLYELVDTRNRMWTIGLMKGITE